MIMPNFETLDTPYNFVVIPLALPGFSRFRFRVRKNARPQTQNMFTWYKCVTAFMSSNLLKRPMSYCVLQSSKKTLALLMNKCLYSMRFYFYFLHL